MEHSDRESPPASWPSHLLGENTAEVVVTVYRFLDASKKFIGAIHSDLAVGKRFNVRRTQSFLSARVSWWDCSSRIFRPSELGKALCGVTQLHGFFLLLVMVEVPALRMSCWVTSLLCCSRQDLHPKSQFFHWFPWGLVKSNSAKCQAYINSTSSSQLC